MNPRFSVRDILTEGMQALGVGKTKKKESNEQVLYWNEWLKN